jgi:catechol 2,3-dioxygenase-like lactoylglutathione lyase family enzyme
MDMKVQGKWALLAAAALLGTAGGTMAAAQPAIDPASVSEPVVAPDATPAKPVFAQESMNVFRRFPVEQRAAMVNYYDKVLGLKSLSPIQLSPNMQMILFRVGQTGQIKLSTGLTKNRTYHLGGINEATGIRLYTIRFADEAALVGRFTAAGLPAPAFKDVGGTRSAFVKDPGGFNLQLVIDPAATGRGVDVGINVTDLTRSRAFYRDFAGLEELPAVKDPVLGVTRYPFRNGETTISLWQAGKKLPADTGSAGIQYVIGNIYAVNAAAKARKVAVETPLGGVRGFDVMTVWLNDPDGVTNYFYQRMPRQAAAK